MSVCLDLIRSRAQPTQLSVRNLSACPEASHRSICAAERGIVKDVIFRGNHLDVVVDVGGIPIVTERSLEKDPVEIGEKVYVLIYRLYIFDENQTYLVENREMQEGEVFYI